MAFYRCPHCLSFSVVADTSKPNKIRYVCSSCHREFDESITLLNEDNVQAFPGQKEQPQSNLQTFLEKKRK